MSYSEADALSANAAIDKYRGDTTGEVAAAMAIVGLCSERVLKETAIRDDMVRVAARAGASLRQLAEVSGLGRKTITAIVDADPRRNAE